MKKEYQDRIDEYLLKRMSPDDCVAFEKVVAENQELQEQLSFTEEVRHAMRSRNEKLAKMKEWDKETYSKPRLSNRRFYYWASGIAALFIIGVITISTYLSSDVKTMSADYAQTDSLCDTTTVDEYAFIEKYLAEKSYSKALEQIDAKIETLLYEDYLVPDCAVNDEETDILDTALFDSACLDNEIDNNDYSLGKNEGRLAHLRLLKARSLIGLNRIDEALKLLDELRTDRSKYGLQADSLYKLLKR